MMWARVDDGIFDNPKFVVLSKDAQLLYFAGLTFSAKHLTDGHLTPRSVRVVRALANARASAVKELVGARLWEVNSNGYAIHDWSDYNPSAARVLATREARRVAGRAGGQVKALANSQAKPQANCQTESQPNSLAPDLPRIPYPVDTSKEVSSPLPPLSQEALLEIERAEMTDA